MSASTSEAGARGRSVRLLAAAALLSLGAGAFAQGSTTPADAAGRFINVTGEVSIVAPDGSRRAAQRNDSLREGESIVTGGESLAQLRMRDGSLFSVRADTEAKLDQFRYAGRDDREAGFAMSIVKGGFRTITGLIAQLNRSNYRITTPAATIGVRGTHFEAVHLPVPLQQVPAGTYNQVFEGITQLNSAGANLVVSRNQTAFAGLGNVQPVLIAPPPALFGRPTPVPRAAAPTQERAAEKAAPASLGQDGLPGRRELAPAAREGTTREGLRDLGVPTRTDRVVAPIDSESLRTLSPTAPTTTLERSTTILSPTAPTTTLERSTTILSPTAPTTTILSPTAPTTTILSPLPTTTILSPTAPTTTIQTIQPSIQTIQPSTTTIQSPTTTKIQTPTTTTTSPTRTISPTLSR